MKQTVEDLFLSSGCVTFPFQFNSLSKKGKWRMQGPLQEGGASGDIGNMTHACAAGGGQVLCYGRVARDARPDEGAAVFRVPVEVSPGQFTDLLSSEVYSFRGGSAGPAGSEQDVGVQPHSATATPSADESTDNGAATPPDTNSEQPVRANFPLHMCRIQGCFCL